MEDNLVSLRSEYGAALRRVAELKVELDQAEGRLDTSRVPHYSLIENAAHEVGQLVSRMVQKRMLDEVVAEQPTVAKCPVCRTRCSLEPSQRSMTSCDGKLDLQELVGHCPVCRRDFFPLA